MPLEEKITNIAINFGDSADVNVIDNKTFYISARGIGDVYISLNDNSIADVFYNLQSLSGEGLETKFGDRDIYIRAEFIQRKNKVYLVIRSGTLELDK